MSSTTWSVPFDCPDDGYHKAPICSITRGLAEENCAIDVRLFWCRTRPWELCSCPKEITRGTFVVWILLTNRDRHDETSWTAEHERHVP